MKKLIIPCLAAVFATASSYAAPADDIKAAAKKLADSANYSWSATTEAAGGGGGGGGGFGGGPVSGKAEKGGFVVTTRTTQNGSMQTVRKGEQVVTQNQEGAWMTMEELMAARGGGGAGGAPGAGAGGNRGGGGAGRGGFGGGGALPADEVVALAGAVKDLKAADGAIVGDLTSEGVAQRLTFGRGGRGGGGGGGTPPAAPTNASGSVKFWLKDGALVKYEVHVKGTVEGRNGPQEVDRTTTTEIKDVGTTKVDVPEAAKKKFSA